MTAERQLWEALERLAEERRLRLDCSPGAFLMIPIKDGSPVPVSMVFLSTAP